MNREEALDVVAMVLTAWPTSQVWTPDEMERYGLALLDLDAALTAKAVAKAHRTEKFRPSVAVIREYVREEQRQQTFLSKPSFLGLEEQTELQPWIRTWVIARVRHKDFRVLPEQKEGYDTLQRDNPYHRDYVWPDQEHMDAGSVAAYQAEGAGLTAADVFRLIS